MGYFVFREKVILYRVKNEKLVPFAAFYYHLTIINFNIIYFPPYDYPQQAGEIDKTMLSRSY